MPVVDSFDPDDLASLQSEIDETESVGEICELVKTHVSSQCSPYLNTTNISSWPKEELL
jgi:hypothetical protein